MRSLCTATKSSPRSPQLEKARVQQRRPNAAKNKINLFKKKFFLKDFLKIAIDNFIMHLKLEGEQWSFIKANTNMNLFHFAMWLFSNLLWSWLGQYESCSI